MTGTTTKRPRQHGTTAAVVSRASPPQGQHGQGAAAQSTASGSHRAMGPRECTAAKTGSVQHSPAADNCASTLHCDRRAQAQKDAKTDDPRDDSVADQKQTTNVAHVRASPFGSIAGLLGQQRTAPHWRSGDEADNEAEDWPCSAGTGDGGSQELYSSSCPPMETPSRSTTAASRDRTSACIDAGPVPITARAAERDQQTARHELEPRVPADELTQAPHVAHVWAPTCSSGGGLPTKLRTTFDGRAGDGHDADDKAEAGPACAGIDPAGSWRLSSRSVSPMGTPTSLLTADFCGNEQVCIGDPNASNFRGTHGRTQQEPGHPSDHCVPVAEPNQETHVGHVWVPTCVSGHGAPAQQLRTCAGRSADAVAAAPHRELRQGAVAVPSTALCTPHATDASVELATTETLVGAAGPNRLSQIPDHDAVIASPTHAGPKPHRATGFGVSDEQLGYFGPFSFGTICTVVEPVRHNVGCAEVGVIVSCRGVDARVLASLDPNQEQRLVFDGRATYAVPLNGLRRFFATTADVPRALAHFSAGTSPRCEAPSGGASPRWAWLTAQGLRSAATRELAVARGSIRHLVGRAGRIVTRLEDTLGVMIGISDGATGTATVVLCGPQERLDFAAEVVVCLSKGLRSILDRLRDVP